MNKTNLNMKRYGIRDLLWNCVAIQIGINGKTCVKHW